MDRNFSSKKALTNLVNFMQFSQVFSFFLCHRISQHILDNAYDNTERYLPKPYGLLSGKVPQGVTIAKNHRVLETCWIQKHK